ncbi:5947_t:CDS:2 [Entrophospora sp. SA101]|nr:5947_t:CDS:2 [Entrophospora sp. SA101]
MVRLTRSKAAMNYGQTIKEEDDSSRSVIKGKRSRKKIIESTKEVDNKPKTLQDKLLDIWKVIRFHKDGRDEDDFVNDMDLMFNNAKRYNVEGSQIYDDAVTLSKLVYKLIGGKFENEENQTYKILQEIEYKGETYFVENHEYRDEDDFVNDMDLMFNNAKRYNVEGSQIYDDAVTLSKLVYKLIGGKFENEENQTYKILQEIEYKGETYFVGEYVHIYNEYDNEKPHIVHIYKLWENNK